MERLELNANGKKVDLTYTKLDPVVLSGAFWELYGDSFIGRKQTNSDLYLFDGIRFTSPESDADVFAKVGVMVNQLSNNEGTGALDKHMFGLSAETSRLKGIYDADTNNADNKKAYEKQDAWEKNCKAAMKMLRGMNFITKFIQHVKADKHSTPYLKWSEVVPTAEGLNFGGVYYKFGDREQPLQQPVMVKNTGKLITHGANLNIPLYEGDNDVPHVFLQKLEYAMPDIVDREYFQTLIGSLLHPKAKTVCFAEGPSNTGKSALLQMVMKAASPYFSTSGQEYLFGSSESSAGATEGQLKMKDITCCFVDELEENQRINKAKLKRVTGSSPVEAKMMHGHTQEVELSTNVLIITNELPDYLAMMEEGFQNRVHITPHFQRYTKGSEPVFMTADGKPLESVTEVECYIREHELRAILGWAVEGLKKYIANGMKLNVPDAIERRRNDIFAKAATGDVSTFLEETGTYFHPTLRTDKLRTAPHLSTLIKMVKKSCGRPNLSGKTVTTMLKDSGAIIEVYKPGTPNKRDVVVNWCWTNADCGEEEDESDVDKCIVIDGKEALEIKIAESAMQYGSTIGSATISMIMRGRAIGKNFGNGGHIHDDTRDGSSSIY